MADDAAGILALELLSQTDLPEDTDIVDGGTGGMSLLHTLRKYNAVVLMDAVDMGLAPGQVEAFSPNEVTSLIKRRKLSVHESDLLEVLRIAQQLNECPKKVVICAIQPKLIEPKQELTSDVQMALPMLSRRASAELRKLHV